jgi:hypothetical protein
MCAAVSFEEVIDQDRDAGLVHRDFVTRHDAAPDLAVECIVPGMEQID